MLSKLLKNDLRKDMRWLWIFFVVTIGVACLSRGCKYFSDNLVFFTILKIFIDSIAYALIANCIIQPFLRGFFNFTKSFYGDEAYLTHTLPVTKNQLLNSKVITTVIEMLLGFATVIVSLLIMFVSPTMFDTLQMLISTIVSGNLSIYIFLVIFVTLIMIEFFMYISIIFYSIVLAYKQKEKRILKIFANTIAMAFISISILSVVLLFILLINGVELTNISLILPKTAFVSVLLTGIIMYSFITIFFYYLTKKEFNKGIDVD